MLSVQSCSCFGVSVHVQELEMAAAYGLICHAPRIKRIEQLRWNNCTCSDAEYLSNLIKYNHYLAHSQMCIVALFR